MFLYITIPDDGQSVKNDGKLSGEWYIQSVRSGLRLNNFTTKLKNVDNITLSRCKVGDDVILIREHKIDKPDYVSVTNKNGEYIGDLNSADASHHYLAHDIDHGSEVLATIDEIFIKNKKVSDHRVSDFNVE